MPSFIQKIENLEFTEAIEFLAQRFSIPLQYDEENSPSAKPAVSRSLKSDLYELHKLVAEWFHQRLLVRSGFPKCQKVLVGRSWV